MDHEPRGHGGTNWVTRSKPGNKGQLPAYIQHIRNDLMDEKGMPEGHATAIAVSQVKKWASGVGNVKPDTRAKAVAAVAEWEKMRGKNAAKDLKETDALHRWTIAKGLLMTLNSDAPKVAKLRAVGTARTLLEGRKPRHLLAEPVPSDIDPTRKLLNAEARRCSLVMEAIAPTSRVAVRKPAAPKRLTNTMPTPKVAAAPGPAKVEEPAAQAKQKTIAKSTLPKAPKPKVLKPGGKPPKVQEAVAEKPKGKTKLPKGDKATKVSFHLKSGAGMDGQPSVVVAQLQHRLAELGYVVNADGRFGDVTHEALLAFQKDAGLPETGEADPTTVRLLRSPPGEINPIQSEQMPMQSGIFAAPAPPPMPGDPNAMPGDPAGQPQPGQPQAQPNQQAQQPQATPGAQPHQQNWGMRTDPTSIKAAGQMLTNRHRGSIQEAPASLSEHLGNRSNYDPNEPVVTAGEAYELPQHPPGLGEGTTQQCRTCVHFDGAHRCLLYHWDVDRGDTCDSYRTLTAQFVPASAVIPGNPVVEPGAEIEERLAEAVAERKAAAKTGNTPAFVAARARERMLRIKLEEGFGHAIWSEAKHPRGRGGKFAASSSPAYAAHKYIEKVAQADKRAPGPPQAARVRELHNPLKKSPAPKAGRATEGDLFAGLHPQPQIPASLGRNTGNIRPKGNIRVTATPHSGANPVIQHFSDPAKAHAYAGDMRSGHRVSVAPAHDRKVTPAPRVPQGKAAKPVTSFNGPNSRFMAKQAPKPIEKPDTPPPPGTEWGKGTRKGGVTTHTAVPTKPAPKAGNDTGAKIDSLKQEYEDSMKQGRHEHAHKVLKQHDDLVRSVTTPPPTQKEADDKFFTRHNADKAERKDMGAAEGEHKLRSARLSELQKRRDQAAHELRAARSDPGLGHLVDQHTKTLAALDAAIEVASRRTDDADKRRKGQRKLFEGLTAKVTFKQRG